MVKFVKLGDVCLVRRGTSITRKDTIEGTIPVIAGGRKATYHHNKQNRDSGTITISGSGASAGLVNYWSVPIFASDCSTVELIDNKQNIKFLYYYLQSKQEFIYKNLISGAAQPHVYAKDIANLNYPLVPIEEQLHIVAKLEVAFAETDKAIINNKKNLINLKNLINKIFDKSLEENKYKKIFLNDICEVERGSSPRPIKSFLTEKEDGVNWIKIGDTEQDGKYILTTKQKITKDGAKKSRKVKKGDFVLTNSMSYGRPYIMAIDGCVHDGWFVLKLKEDIDSDFFFYLLSSSKVQSQFKSLAAGSVVKNISGNLVKKTMLLIPPKNIQIEIKKKIIFFNECIQKIKKITVLKNINYQKLKLSISNNLMNGH